jgi:REP element-mobilizing transposase RayT
MSGLFQNKYRISSTRLQSWNYANEGMYFTTICTKNRICYFGDISETTSVETQCIASLNRPCQLSMHQSEIGKIAETEWYKTKALRPDMNLELAEFVVMPNHLHGIIIGENKFNSKRSTGGCSARDAMHCVSTEVVPTIDNSQNNFAPQSKNLAAIIRGYKSAVTTHARKNNISFNWQPGFHDHIIRSMNEYHSISDYIMNNVAHWQKDKFFVSLL